MRSSRRRTHLDDFSTHALHAQIFSVSAPSGACVCVRASASASVRLRLCFCVSVRLSACPSVLLRVRPPVCVSVHAFAGRAMRAVRLRVRYKYIYVTVHAIGKIDKSVQVSQDRCKAVDSEGGNVLQHPLFTVPAPAQQFLPGRFPFIIIFIVHH